jgi:fucose permease
LLAGSLIRGLGALGFVLAPNWTLFLAAGVVGGAGVGIMDAVLNTYFATHHSPRATNWLHACFGLGTTIGPLLMDIVARMELGWQTGYLVSALLFGALALSFFVTAKIWKQVSLVDETPPKGEIFQALRRPWVWLGIALFFVYTGIEGTAGQWSFTYLTRAQATPAEQARFWVGAYWGTFTVGRVLFGLIANRFPADKLLRISMLCATVAAGLLWWNPIPLVGYLALALLGLMLAPIYPLSITDTPRRVGRRLAPYATGFQVSSAGLGIALLPWLFGVTAARAGLEIMGPALVGGTLLMLVLERAGSCRSVNLYTADAGQGT